MRTNYKNFAQTTITPPNGSITTLTGDVVLSELFPTSNFYAVIEQLVSGIIIKREVVFCPTRTDESFTVTRGYDGTPAQDFTVGGGTIYLSINSVAGHFDDIRDETESLDTRITTNEGDISSAESNITALQGQVGAIDVDLTALENSAVLKTGDQTVAGIKTFSSSPIVPTPTTSTQATNKSYVDGIAGFSTSAVTGVSGTATIAHGLGRTPKQLIVFGYADNNVAKPFHGIRQASNDKSIQIQSSGQSYSDNFIGYSGTATATVSSVDSTNINLSWTGSGDNLDYTIFCLA